MVSGPIGTSVTGPSRPIARRGSRPRARPTGPRCGARQLGPVEPGLAVDVGGDEAARGRAGGRRPPRPATSAAPASSSTRIAFAVVFSSVWLPGDRGDAEQLELGARKREQERDRVVVARVAVDEDRGRRHAASIASTSAAVGSEGCAPKREAASAPAAHARRSASSRGRPSSSETTRHAVKASPAAVPSTASTARRRGARDLPAVLEQDGALRAERERGQPRRCSPSASSS